MRKTLYLQKRNGDSILHYPPKRIVLVLVNSQTVDKNFTVFTLKESAHALCEGAQRSSGQRDGLSHTDITDIATYHGSTCSKKISKHIISYS